MRPNAWYRNALFYSLAVDTFADSDGDGVGDFRGLTSRLDYLSSLGVDALWLAPFQPSPWRDDGYDISDYYGVHPKFGSSGDFAEFMQQCSDRGIRVLLDLVANHTSDRHPWFAAAKRDERSPYRDWYIWSKKRPRDARSGVVFPGVQKSTWSYAKEARAWYFHRFLDFQPDLNMANPAVRREIGRVITYWLRLGASGFRMDAVPFVLEKPGTKEPQFQWLRELRHLLQWREGDAILLGEANIEPRNDAEYFADDDGLHMIFNFWVNQHLFAALATEDARPLAKALNDTRRIPEQSHWAFFLRNHDELDLGRLDDAVRRQVFERYAPEETMQLYGRGIRRRLAPMLGERALLELAYSLVFALPGATVLRYGEEIGMGENLRLKERDAIRTPMQWSREQHGGFTTAGEPVRPVIDSGPYAYEQVNVRDQLRDSGSLLRFLIGLIRVRKEAPQIGNGEWRVLATRKPSVFALEYGSQIVTTHNVASTPVEFTIETAGNTLESLLGPETSRGRGGKHRLKLEPYGYAWYRIGV
jgi:maltose alpha-D-glucosyltransferase / alpha-amylase